MASITLVSAAPDRLVPFIEALCNAGAGAVHHVATAEAAVACARQTPPALMIIDRQVDMPVFALVAELMKANALINTAVISEASADDFEQTSEGLGVLMQLPDPPGPEDAAALTARLKGLGAI